MSSKDTYALLLLILGLFRHNLHIRDATAQSLPIGVCYTTAGNNLPPPQEVVNLYKSHGIGMMRIYNPQSEILKALRGSNIQLILGVPNAELQSLATNPSVADQWVKTNVSDYWPQVKFRYIGVGNEVGPSDAVGKYVLPAMQNIHNSIRAIGLQDQIKVSTVASTVLLGTSFPPSQGSFRDQFRSFIDPIVGFLVNTSSPLLVNLYPYFSYTGNPESVRLSYALFSAPGLYILDGELVYENLFDAMLDAYYSALERAGGGSVEIVVTETGWPSEGESAATTENAATYYANLINHISEGTPKRPRKPIETYLFTMFDENLKTDFKIAQHFGIFYPNGQLKYQLLSFDVRRRYMVMVCN